MPIRKISAEMCNSRGYHAFWNQELGLKLSKKRVVYRLPNGNYCVPQKIWDKRAKIIEGR